MLGGVLLVWEVSLCFLLVGLCLYKVSVFSSCRLVPGGGVGCSGFCRFAILGGGGLACLLYQEFQILRLEGSGDCKYCWVLLLMFPLGFIGLGSWLIFRTRV